MDLEDYAEKMEQLIALLEELEAETAREAENAPPPLLNYIRTNDLERAILESR